MIKMNFDLYTLDLKAAIRTFELLDSVFSKGHYNLSINDRYNCNQKVYNVVFELNTKNLHILKEIETLGLSSEVDDLFE
jgi:hypothetical protein